MLDLLFSPEAWVSLATLTFLEIVLGIDNIVFIAILTSRVERSRQLFVRRVGLAAAFFSRVALLGTLSWIVRMQEPFMTLLGKAISGKDLVLIGGGLFLLVKAVIEIFRKVELQGEENQGAPLSARSFFGIIGQIILIDIVFSLDSVITAVGLVNDMAIMVTAVLLAILVMIAFADPIGRFIDGSPSVTILALAFLILIGVLLIGEGFGQKIDKAFVYFGMLFALSIEMLNQRYHANRRRRDET